MNTEIVTIPEFTADEFYNTSEPYEFLYQYRKDKFLLKQLVQKMKAQAGAVGVKCFISLWNAYNEMIAQQQGICLENSTQFSNQDLELFSGRYICDEYGVVVEDKYGFEQVICRHPIMPVERLVNIDNGEERLKIAYKKGSAWRYIIAEKSVLASSNSILQLAATGVLVNSENAKSLSSYLLEMEQLNYEELPEQKSVGRLGWVGEHGFSPYVDGLVFDGENNFKHIFGSVQAFGDREAWLGAMRKVREERSFGRIFLAASFASALVEPCGLLPFFVHAWGGTEVGKTVGLMIAASVWASPKIGDYITTFNSTLVGQEMTASFLNSLPMCIDELQIQSSAGIKDFDRIIYQLTEGVGRTRGAKTGGLQKANTWKNCIITNGEHPISNASSGGGAVNRIIEFECTEKIYSDLVWLCSVINQNYGFAGKEFVKCLQEKGIVETVERWQKEYFRQLLKFDSTEKQAASASAILAADRLATLVIFDDKNRLTVEEMAAYMTKKNDVDANARAYEYIIELPVRNPAKFYYRDDYSGEIWGKEDHEYIYMIKSVFDREMGIAGFNSTAFLSWLKRKGGLQTDPGRRTKNCRVFGRTANCVVISKNAKSDVIFEGTESKEPPFDQ